MTQFPRKTLLPVLLITLTASALGTSVINSDNWKSVAKAQNHAHLNGQETFTIATPPDAKIAASTLENPETLYTTSSPTFAELERRTALNFNQVINVEELNYTDHEGFVVVDEKFGTDAVSVLPYAARNNYRLVFYDEKTPSILENSSKSKTFYGDFDFDPAERYSNTEYINNTWQERNLKIARRMDTEWAVLTPRSYFNPSMVEDKPVLFRMNRRKLADFIDSSDIDRIKVVGAENMLYAKEIDVLTEKDLEIAVKTGRAFTGISGFDGIYGLKKIDTPYRRYNLKLENVRYDNSSSIMALDFVNKGNTVRQVKGTMDTGEREAFDFSVPEFSSISYTLNVSRNFSSLQLNYSTEKTEEETETFSRQEVSYSTVAPLTNLDVVSLNRSEGLLEVAIKNTGDRAVWTMVQTGDSVSRERIEPGESGRHVIQGIDASESYKIFQGDFRNQYSYSNVRIIEEESRPDYTLLIVVVIALVLLAAAGYVVYEFTS